MQGTVPGSFRAIAQLLWRMLVSMSNVTSRPDLSFQPRFPRLAYFE